jgi:hypothetical protein
VGDASADAGPPYPTKLSETGLYADIANDVLADGVSPFSPAYPLWTDGATKRRFIYLPPGTSIDTSDIDHWRFPVGTKAWKEFTRDGVRIETRMIEKTATGWWMLAYVWNDTNDEANVTLLPVRNAHGTEHDVPSRAQCVECHDSQPDRLLGFSAIQLSHVGPGVTLDTLITDQRLSAPPSGPLVLPGDAIDQAALGMLHANCGNCHTPDTVAFERADGMELWLTVGRLGSLDAVVTAQSSVATTLTSFNQAGFTQRIVPGDHVQSALWYRMSQRGNEAQMPPLGTELVNQAGLDQLAQWIDRMPQ